MQPPSYEQLVLEGTIQRVGKYLPSYEESLKLKEEQKLTTEISQLSICMTKDGLPILSISPLIESPVILVPLDDNTDEIIADYQNADYLNNSFVPNQPINLIKNEFPETIVQKDYIDHVPIQQPQEIQQKQNENHGTLSHQNSQSKNEHPEELPSKKKREKKEEKKEENKEDKQEEKNGEIKPKRRKKTLKSRVGSFLKDAKEMLDFRLITPIASSQVHVYQPGRENTKRINPITDEELLFIGEECLRLTNDFREERNIQGKLEWSDTMYIFACQHSLNMSEKTVPFGHHGFEDRVSNFPFTSYRSAENVFTCKGHQRNKVAELAVQGWINSPGHCANLLGDYNACAIGVCQMKGEYYFTQLFAQR